MKVFHAFLLVAVAAVSVKAEAQLPSFIKVCSRDDPELNQCVTESIMGLRDNLKLGIPDLKTPSIDPLLLGDVLVQTGGFKMSARGVAVQGGIDYKITDMNVDLQGSVKFHMKFPKLNVESDYELLGTVMLSSITGRGSVTGEFKDVDIEVSMTIKPGKNLVLESLTLKSNVGDGKVVVKDSNEAASVTISESINANMKETLEYFMPPIDKALSDKIEAIARDVLQIFTFDQLFPPKSRKNTNTKPKHNMFRML